jgi:Acyl-CoA dehydrogenase, C-terminal domain
VSVIAAMQDCERAARDRGLAAGLARALAGALADTPVQAVAPGRYAAVCAGDVPEGAAVRTHRLAGAEGITFVHCPGERPPGGPGLSDLGRLLAAVRLGLVRRTLDLAVAHLSGRDGGGEPLSRKQLVTGAIADIVAGVELLRAQAQSQHDQAGLQDVHARIDELGWEVAKLFGAAGYLADHPARALYVSALAANTWIAAEGARQ